MFQALKLRATGSFLNSYVTVIIGSTKYAMFHWDTNLTLKSWPAQVRKGGVWNKTKSRTTGNNFVTME
jgi:hypothetical protein